MTPTVLVTGGTGRLGHLVVARLLRVGCDVRVIARHERQMPDVAFFVADLRAGDRIDRALSGVDTIIHCATATRGDAHAVRNLTTAAARTGAPHFVQPSIVGIDRIPRWGYPGQKLEAEATVEGSGLPWTILRVTQFYDYCFENSRRLARCPVVAPVPARFPVQPIDPDEVAGRLVGLALDQPRGRAPDMAGPQPTSWAALLRSYLAATRRSRIVIPVRVPGSTAVRDGALLPGPGHTTGVNTWEQFLATRLHRPMDRPGRAAAHPHR